MAEPGGPPRYLPVWTAYNLNYPWRILDTTTGDLVRMPPVGNVHQALLYRTPAAAWAKIAKLNRKRGAR